MWLFSKCGAAACERGHTRAIGTTIPFLRHNWQNLLWKWLPLCVWKAGSHCVSAGPLPDRTKAPQHESFRLRFSVDDLTTSKNGVNARFALLLTLLRA